MTKVGKVPHYLSDAAEVIEVCRPSTYIHDICIRCGKIAAPSVIITNEHVPTPDTPNKGERAA